jgi:hypothetical protein
MFSKYPWGEIVDRTGLTTYPFQLDIRQPWQGPLRNISLEDTCEETVNHLIQNNPGPYYIYWSGGIDSTLVLISFFKHLGPTNFSVVCSSASIAENTYLYENFIKPNCVVYDSTQELPTDGTHITGDCGDTVWATLDAGFWGNPIVRPYIYEPWQTWFNKKTQDQDFLNFSSEFFQRSGKDIVTLFDARWWYYLICKSQSKAVYKTAGSFNGFPNLNLVHFFENKFMDSWSWHNSHNMIRGMDWLSYKWPAKDLIYQFDSNSDYRDNKTKGYSSQLEHNRLHKDFQASLRRPLFITNDNQRPTLDTAPFFSYTEYQEKYYNKYAHLFEPGLPKIQS